MDPQSAAILGAWIFAGATALSKQVSALFMLVAFIIAIVLTIAYI